MKAPVSIFGPFGQGPVIPLVLEAPHASFDVPESVGAVIPRDRLLSHEGHDIGSREIAEHLYRELNGWLITSERSRLIIEHNRTVDHHHTKFDWSPLPHVQSRADRQRHIDEHHKPYADAVESVIKRVIADERLPVVVSVHTYTPETDGLRRRPFAVVGDEASTLVKVLKAQLQIVFNAASATGQLSRIADLTPTDLKNPIALNEPYNLNDVLPCGSANDFRKGVMAPCYAEGIGLPWVLVETRQDIAHEPAIKKIFLLAMQRTLAHPDVQNDFRQRERAFFSTMPRAGRRGMTGPAPAAGHGPSSVQ